MSTVDKSEAEKTSQADEQRLRKLTEKGQQEYEANLKSFNSKLQLLKDNVDYDIETFKSKDQTYDSIIVCNTRITTALQRFLEVAEEFTQYLTRKNTAESQRELRSHESIYKDVELYTEKVLQDIAQRKQAMKVSKSVSMKSGSSRGSGKSSVNSSIIKMRARAEATKASLEYAEKEAELKKTSAEMQRKQMINEADLELLNQQKAAAAAKAEYEGAMDELGSQRDIDSLHDIPKLDEQERTRQYVEDQRNLMLLPPSRHDPFPNVSSAPFIPRLNNPHVSPQQHGDSVINLNSSPSPLPENPSFPKPPVDNNATLSDFSRFLLKKDLLMSRFNRFNDRPESYALWKSSFQAITKELQVTAVEESELLIKWLGSESMKFAQSIRTSNINDPQAGLYKIWQRLEERFGSPEMVETSLKSKINDFPKIMFKDVKRLYDLQDILTEILSTKNNPVYAKLLSYFDTSVGVNPIVNKLPPSFQNKWRDKATSYKRSKNEPYPPFWFFVEFISDQASKYNDPGFKFDHDQTNHAPYSRDKGSGQSNPKPQQQRQRSINVNKTDIDSSEANSKLKEKLKCAIHKSNHSLNECRSFRSKSYEDRQKIVKDNNICFKCLNSAQHRSRNCPEQIRCEDCGSSTHSTGMHTIEQNSQTAKPHGGENTAETNVSANCLDICDGDFSGKSCAKILQVTVSHIDNPDNRFRVYAMLDEQSNKSLGRTKLFDSFNFSCKSEEYTLTSCSGKTQIMGRRANGLVVESLDGLTKVKLPTVIECDGIPDNRNEIPTADVARHHSHLRDIESEFQPLNQDVDILLLLGRDIPEVHHIVDQRVGPINSPYAQKTPLGWVIVGDVCLDKRHPPDSVNTYKTLTLTSGRPSILQPCPNMLKVRENIALKNKLDNFDCDSINLGDGIFDRTQNDDQPGTSVEDKIFLQIMDKGFHKDYSGNWSAPLPFKPNRDKLPNNFPMALRRAKSLDHSLQQNEKKREHFIDFMQNLVDNQHAEPVPTLEEGADESWHLPVFGIYHPKKPDKIRCVFDSSAKFGNVSLNNVLLSGPDLNNSLLGVLLRFRKNRIAASADIQQMFYSFRVDEKHRDFLRFLWHRDNDLQKELIPYRMTVHVFGNSPSPSVAIYGLKKCVENSDQDVQDFVNRHFYVDDGLISVDESQEMISLLIRTQESLMKAGNIRLHKFACNSEDVMAALPPQDIAQDLKDLYLDSDTCPLQRSLGLYWNLRTDMFTYRISDEIKPFTRRGVLSTLNSVYDPLGFVAPVLIRGKWLLRDLMSSSIAWDDPLPEEKRLEWETWRESLKTLENFEIPRMYIPSTPTGATPSYELHVFADASEKAIGAIAYLRTVYNNHSDLGFVLGKAKVAPQHGHSIPRLELCASVLAVEMAETVVENLDLTFDVIKFYTDSKVVLGYIHNQTRRFYIYVEHRIERIRRSTTSEQWNFVPTAINPADQATRSVAAEDIGDSRWIKGPTSFLCSVESSELESPSLINPDYDKEIRPIVSVSKTEVSSVRTSKLGTDRFQRFSKWNSLVRAITLLRRVIRTRSMKPNLETKVESIQESETFLIKTVQQDMYQQEIDCLRHGRNLSKNSSIVSLDPFLDKDGVLRVGGRLNKSNCISYQEKNPLILPGKCYLAKLIVEHYHSNVKHQGRHFTEGAVRSAGFWITGLKRLVSSIIHHCVMCRRLRGRLEIQQMADLPSDRIQPTPPFTNVGVDAFGPWSVIQRRTRGGISNSKRWAIIFSCLTTRAIHIEVVEEMSSGAFINAMRRFIAIRGKVNIFRSDRGTNFVGAMDSLHIDTINVEDPQIGQFLDDARTTWIFNPPHASHFGGAWERLIGVTRRILDSMLLQSTHKFLTHDVLVTFMAEVTSIVNHRPLVPVSTDKDNPFVLSPSVLLTQKLNTPSCTDLIEQTDHKDLLRAEWKRVVALSDMFWSRWRKEYLNNLQARKKWQSVEPNVKEGDVVLLRDKTLHRNEWPLGIVLRTFESDDTKVRKTEIRIVKDGKPTTYIRPIGELIVLVPAD